MRTRYDDDDDELNVIGIDQDWREPSDGNGPYVTDWTSDRPLVAAVRRLAPALRAFSEEVLGLESEVRVLRLPEDLERLVGYVARGDMARDLEDLDLAWVRGRPLLPGQPRHTRAQSRLPPTLARPLDSSPAAHRRRRCPRRPPRLSNATGELRDLSQPARAAADELGPVVPARDHDWRCVRPEDHLRADADRDRRQLRLPLSPHRHRT